MAHVFVLAEARKLWMDIFVSDLTKRRYEHQMVNGNLGYAQPNPREVKLFDISLPEQCIPDLLADLAPYVNPVTPLKKRSWLLAKVIKLLTGLKVLPPMPKPSYELRKQWVNIIPIGWKEDPRDPNTALPHLPKGGELI